MLFTEISVNSVKKFFFLDYSFPLFRCLLVFTGEGTTEPLTQSRRHDNAVSVKSRESVKIKDSQIKVVAIQYFQSSIAVFE
jgi:hypothetical protein